MAQVDSNYEKNLRSKILLDFHFKADPKVSAEVSSKKPGLRRAPAPQQWSQIFIEPY